MRERMGHQLFFSDSSGQVSGSKCIIIIPTCGRRQKFLTPSPGTCRWGLRPDVPRGLSVQLASPFKGPDSHLPNPAQLLCQRGERPDTPPRQGVSHTRMSWQCPAQGVPGKAASPTHSPPRHPPTSKAARRVTVFTEEVPQMGSGRSVGGRQAARRAPENAKHHRRQASES